MLVIRAPCMVTALFFAGIKMNVFLSVLSRARSISPICEVFSMDNFARTAVGTRKINIAPKVMRGGIRL